MCCYHPLSYFCLLRSWSLSFLLGDEGCCCGGCRVTRVHHGRLCLTDGSKETLTKHSPVLLCPKRHTLTFRRLPTRSASLRTPTSYSLCTFSLLPLSASLPPIVVPALFSSSSAASSPSPRPFVILLFAQVLVVGPLLSSLAAAVARQLQGALKRLRGLGEPTHTSCTGLGGTEFVRREDITWLEVMITEQSDQLYIVSESFLMIMRSQKYLLSMCFQRCFWLK